MVENQFDLFNQPPQVDENIIRNTAYKTLRAFVEEHHGWSPGDFEDHPEVRIMYDEFMDKLKRLDGSRVEINFHYEADFVSGNGTKTGRIKVATSDNRKEHIRFFEGKKRSKFYYLDAGLLEGFYATLIPMQIKIL